MTGWALVWKIVVTTALVSYFGLAFVIAVGGFNDVKKMFRRLKADDDARNAANGTTPPGA